MGGGAAAGGLLHRKATGGGVGGGGGSSGSGGSGNAPPLLPLGGSGSSGSVAANGGSGAGAHALLPPPASALSGAPSASSSRTSALARVFDKRGVDVPFLALLTVFLVTASIFLVGRALSSGRPHLTPAQRAEYEHRSLALANSTVYMVEYGLPEGLISSLPAASWDAVSAHIDYVAIVYDDLYHFLYDDWMASVEAAFRDGPGPPLGVALFPCGCVIPNAHFRAVGQRFAGDECVLLPGLVYPPERVHWLGGVFYSGGCRRRTAALNGSLAGRVAEVDAARVRVDALLEATAPAAAEAAAAGVPAAGAGTAGSGAVAGSGGSGGSGSGPAAPVAPPPSALGAIPAAPAADGGSGLPAHGGGGVEAPLAGRRRGGDVDPPPGGGAAAGPPLTPVGGDAPGGVEPVAAGGPLPLGGGGPTPVGPNAPPPRVL